MKQTIKRKTLLLETSVTAIEQAVKYLESDELVAFPTETVYGLGASAISDSAVSKIFLVKGRPSFNPLIVHIASPEDAFLLANVPKIAEKLIECFWPGPLTLVLPKKSHLENKLSDLVSGGLETVALRVPQHPTAKALINAFGKPVAAPSANVSGKISTTRTQDVLKNFDGKISAVIRDKPCQIGLESTIIGFEQGIPVLLRPGGISTEDIKAKLNLSISKAKDPQKPGEPILAPGMLESHYAPNTKLRLNAIQPKPGELFLGFGRMPKGSQGFCLSESSDVNEAGANLFAALNDLDLLASKLNKETIAVAPIPTSGMGQAINDRLKRAAATKNYAEPPKVAK